MRPLQNKRLKLLGTIIHPKIVQELLGHSNISMTLDTYSHVLPSLQAEAVSRLNALFTAEENPVAVSREKKAKSRRG